MAFDSDEAKKFLFDRELKVKEEKEQTRKALLAKVTRILREEFASSSTEVFLVGSIIRPYSFSDRSDIDVVLKNFQGDRFEIWTKLENLFGRSVEIILFETCHFREFVLKEGLKVV